MLKPEIIAIVKATAPILEQHGEALTRHFYKRMFSHNPEVLPFFNPSNQHAGTQQKALAAAICAYAANIDNLEVLGSAVELIAQKHASLRILPEHYPIVGENLLASIREVIGAGATDDIINAWAEAYRFLADILIRREGQIYAEHQTTPNGWVDFKAFKIDRKERESSNITSFYLKPVDGTGVPHFKPGQYITVRVPSPCGHTTMRNYSLSDAAGRGYLRISIKREEAPNGYVSNLLHNSYGVGATIEVGPPCGEFFLDVTEKHDRPLVLIAAGVGITPLLSMLQTALAEMQGRKIVFIHAALNEDVQAFRSAIDDLAAKHRNLKTHYRYNNIPETGCTRAGNCSTGLVDGALIESLAGQRDADYYFCGPQPFMVSIYNELLSWGIPEKQVHFEFFGPRGALDGAAGRRAV